MHCELEIVYPVSDLQPDRLSHQPEPNGQFLTTRWSLVQQAAHGGVEEGELAMQALCKAYWYPLYVFVRREGFGASDAEDLTQEFFHRLLKKESVAVADQERGRFRTFLIRSLRNFLIDERRHAGRLKRGGNLEFLPLEEAESAYQEEDPGVSPEDLFDRKWATAVMNRAMKSLGAEYRAAGLGERFLVFKKALVDQGDLSYEALALEAGMSRTAFKTAVHRFRRRYRDNFRREISSLVDDPEDVDDEIRHIMAALT